MSHDFAKGIISIVAVIVAVAGDSSQNAMAASATEGPRASSAPSPASSTRPSATIVNPDFAEAEVMEGIGMIHDAQNAYLRAFEKDGRRNPYSEDGLLGAARMAVEKKNKKEACWALDLLRKEFTEPRMDLRKSIMATHRDADCAHP